MKRNIKYMALCMAALFIFITVSTINQLGSGRSNFQLPATGRFRLKNNEHSCIVFLKAHKCASTTVQNILMRFGYARGLDFVLPSTGNYIGNPEPFHSSLIPTELTSPNKKYDIFTHHTRFNYTEIRSVMRNDCKFVTILRDPASLYESLFSYYKIDESVNVSFNDVIRSKTHWPKLKERILERVGLNQMSWDLGYKEGTSIDSFMMKVNKQFNLVMISEYMEASLVLLADLMNWPLEYVISLKLNSRQMKNTRKLTEDDRDTLIELNSVDAELYDYFLEIFRQKLMKFGKRKLFNRVNKLLKMNASLHSFCVDKMNNGGYARTTGYSLRNHDNWTCIYATKSELSFTDEIRNNQRERFKTMKSLEMLMIDADLTSSRPSFNGRTS